MMNFTIAKQIRWRKIFRRAKEIVKKSWKFLLLGYIFGCFISLNAIGVPNIYYLIPIKATAVLIGWGIGSSIHRALAKRDRKKDVYRISLADGVEDAFFALFLWAVASALVTIVCWGLCIDPMPFYGPL